MFYKITAIVLQHKPATKPLPFTNCSLNGGVVSMGDRQLLSLGPRESLRVECHSAVR